MQFCIFGISLAWKLSPRNSLGRFITDAQRMFPIVLNVENMKPVQFYTFFIFCTLSTGFLFCTSLHVSIRGRGYRPPIPEKSQKYRVSSEYWSGSPEKSQSQHSMLGNHRHASETPFKWRSAGGPMMASL